MLLAATVCSGRLLTNLRSHFPVSVALVTLVVYLQAAAAVVAEEVSTVRTIRCCAPERESYCSAPLPAPTLVSADEVPCAFQI